MRALLQRVRHAAVRVDNETVGDIGPGLLIFVCAMPGDETAVADKLAAKVSKLRLFADADGRMNLSLAQMGGGALVVSQFTLAADTSRGNRPGFSGAAGPEAARQLYTRFGTALSELGVPVAWGRFGADMKVTLENDGPVTIWLDTET